MENSQFAKIIKTESPTTYFFYKLILTAKRPNLKKALLPELLIYLLKYYSFIYYLKIGSAYHDFISWITRYYPFSLLFQNKIYHFNNLKERNFMNKIERLAKKTGLDILIMGGKANEQIIELTAFLEKNKRDKTKALKSLEKILQKKYNTVYIRANKDKIKILFPRILYINLINCVDE